MKTMTFKINDDLLSEIVLLAEELGESRSSVMRRAAHFYVDNYFQAIAENDMKDPERIMIPHETVLKEFGL
ncbi:MAG: CopG family transcriptional regulator [bacterium]